MALNSIEKLRIWCHKVLPLVYDDSLSYYEVLAKVVNKLNEVIALAEEQNETIEEALSDIETFETDLTSQFEAYKTTLDAALDAFEAEITAQQSAFEGRMTQAFADFLADYEREFGITNLYGDSTTLAISQNQVSRLLDYTTNNNRFNPEVVTSGKAIDNTGAVIDNPNTAVTGYIEVQPGENIVAQAKNNTTNERYQGVGTGTDVPLVFDSIAGYDEELNFVSGSFKSLVFNYQVPVGVKYIKIAMGQTILDGTNTDMSELAIVNSDGTIYPYQPYSEQNATVKMNALPVDDTTVGNHLWSANKINAFQAAVEGEIQQLETDLTGTVQGAIGDMNTAFTQKSTELDNKFDTLEGAIQTQQEEFETEIEGALALQKTELETEIGEVASDVQTLSGSVTTQGQTITNLTGIVTNVEGRVDTLETDMAAAKEDISDLEASDAQHTSDITNLIDRVYEAENNIDTLETASEEHTTAISNLQAKDAELEGDINGLTTRIGSAEGDIDLLEGRADTLEGEIPILESGIVNLEENKADKVGYEKDLNVGGADMLIGNGTVTDNKAYNFRRTADGNKYVGNRETDEIIGGTLVVNQIFKTMSTNTARGVTYTKVNDSTFRLNGTVVDSTWYYQHSSTPKAIVGHVYYVDKGSNAPFEIYNDAGGVATGTSARYTVGKATVDNYFFVRMPLGETYDNVEATPMVIDLTQMFASSTIADYIYNLQVTESGAGVAWLFEYFPILNGGFIPHNTGTLQSIVVSKHILTGFNQWNEQWEVGMYNETTGEKDTAQRIRSKNFIKAFPNTKYYGMKDIYNIYCYDSNKNYLGVASYVRSGSGWLFTTLANTQFITFDSTFAYGTTYKNDICISFDSDRNGEYEPYNGHEYTLDSSKELRGIPHIDINGKLYFYGDRYKDGVTRYFTIIDMSMLDYTKYDITISGVTTSMFRALINGIKPHSDQTTAAEILCSKYPKVASAYRADKTIYIQDTVSGIDVVDSSYTDAAEFKAAMSGVMLVYEIATTTTEEATPVPNPQICSPDGTEEYVDPRVEAGTIPFAIPIGHETVYNTSLNYKLNQIPNLPTAAGVYKLQVTVTSGVPSYSWVAEE